MATDVSFKGDCEGGVYKLFSDFFSRLVAFIFFATITQYNFVIITDSNRFHTVSKQNLVRITIYNNQRSLLNYYLIQQFIMPFSFHSHLMLPLIILIYNMPNDLIVIND